MMDKQEVETLLKAEVNYSSKKESFDLQNVPNNLRAYSFGDFSSYYERYVRDIYPVYYPNYVVQKSTMEQAFKVMAKLIENGYFKNLTVQKFMTLVNEIAGVL